VVSIFLIHGALGDRAQLSPLARLLAESCDVHAIELEGHGTTPLATDAYDLARFRDNVRHAIAERGLERAAVFGYSMGGYVALSLAAESPDLVSAVVTLGTKLAWSPESAARETSRLDPAAIRAKVPKFADLLERRHAGAGGWEPALSRTAAMMTALGAQPAIDDAVLARIACPVRLMVGDRDAVVSIDETVSASRALARGDVAVVPGTPHPFEQVRASLIAALTRDFLDLALSTPTPKPA
jgi:pimeloyl-ACP methyl ester carboxylesterase